MRFGHDSGRVVGRTCCEWTSWWESCTDSWKLFCWQFFQESNNEIEQRQWHESSGRSPPWCFGRRPQNSTAVVSEDSEESVFRQRGTSPEGRSCQHIRGQCRRDNSAVRVAHVDFCESVHRICTDTESSDQNAYTRPRSTRSDFRKSSSDTSSCHWQSWWTIRASWAGEQQTAMKRDSPG